MSSLLKEFIKHALREGDNKHLSLKKQEEPEEELDEFTSVAAIAGFTAPLGWRGPGPLKNKKKQKKV